MKIVADENISFVREIFSPLGDVFCVAGRDIKPNLLSDADVLLVRSITNVDRQLLSDSSVRFVGSATIGTDHIDKDWLRSRGIAFAYAPGSNSNSVAEYVFAALLHLGQKYNWLLNDKTLGIIGLGNIGSKVQKKANALGLNVLANDPPLQRQTSDPRFVTLDTVLEQADIITIHVPLTNTGPDATFHLFDKEKLTRLRPHTVLINTSRGKVVDNQAIKLRLQTDALGPTVLDVWENEPDIDPQLLERIAIATPHIAGYSLDGKVNGAVMLYRAICEFFNIPDSLQIERSLPAHAIPVLELDTTTCSDQQLMAKAILTIYDILSDDRNLRQITQKKTAERGDYFDLLRKNYPVRREATNTLVNLTPHRKPLAEQLKLLGFKIA